MVKSAVSPQAKPEMDLLLWASVFLIIKIKIERRTNLLNDV